jgi:hypothetical protein
MQLTNSYLLHSQHYINKQYDSSAADLVDAPDDGPLRPNHVVLRV